MTVRANKPAFNIREKLKELTQSIGLKGRELMRAATVQDARDLVSAGRKNIIFNGSMDIAQRGTSTTISANGGYSLDRYFVQTNVGSGHTWAQVSDAPAGSGLQYSGKITVGTGASPVTDNFGRILYYVEGYDAQQTCFGTSSAKAVTLSFWTKSSVTGTFGGCIKMQFASPYPGFFFTYTIKSANAWEYKQITIPAGTMTGGSMSPSNGIGFLLAFDLGEGPSRSDPAGYNDPSDSGGTVGVEGVTKILATSGATWQITGLQLEVGNNATEFERRSYAEELALCQRYFTRLYFPNSTYVAQGALQNSSNIRGSMIHLPTTLRSVPTASNSGSPDITFSGTGNGTGLFTFLQPSTSNPVTVGSIIMTGVTDSQLHAYGTSFTSLGSTGQTSQLYAGNTAWINISAEL